MTFTFGANYNEELAQYIDELFTKDKAEKLARQTRLDASDRLIEAYVSRTGNRPPSAQLGRLATLILRDELADPHPDKMTREEYPILSESQRDEREKDEVSFKLSQDVASDSHDYRIKTRDSNRKFREMSRELR